MIKRIIISLFIAAVAIGARAAEPKVAISAPDLDKIKTESTDPNSQFYYPRLLKMYMSNDTVMTNEDFQYFYYGSLFQEDFDPYRSAYNEAELAEVEPLYYKSSHTNAEKDRMQAFALASLKYNPIDLIQLKNLVYVYEKKNKVNLAKIWKNKLNHLLLVIASSGTGLDPENAWTVVLPRHEYDFLNLSGITATGQEYVEPYYDHISVQRKSDKDPEGYYFNIRALLEQYYLKHPSELQ